MMENIKVMMKLSNCLMCERELFDDDSLKIELFYEFCCLDIIEHLKHIDLVYEIAKVHHQQQQQQQQNGFRSTSTPIGSNNTVTSTTGNGSSNANRNIDITGLQTELRKVNLMEPKNGKIRDSVVLGSSMYLSSELTVVSANNGNGNDDEPNLLKSYQSLAPWINRDEIGQQNLKLPCDSFKIWDSSSKLLMSSVSERNNDSLHSLEYYLDRKKRSFEIDRKRDRVEFDENNGNDDDDGSGENYYHSLAAAIAAVRTNIEYGSGGGGGGGGGGDDEDDTEDDNNGDKDNDSNGYDINSNCHGNGNSNKQMIGKTSKNKTSTETVNNNSANENCTETIESKLDQAARLHRASASVIQATHKWSGILPRSDLSLQKIYSVKVFVGGLPWDIRETVLIDAFRKFGHVTVDWPGKENAVSSPRGYAYVVFEDEERVRELLAETTRDPVDANRKFFLVPAIKKNIEIVPWPICDSIYQVTAAAQTKPDCSNTVFVGALHGLLTAAHLAHIMSELFGETVFVGLDTDRNRYPIGSGRVIFQERAAFMKSIAAGYVEIKTNKFAKKIQIDPYLEEKLCSVCSVRPGIYFCRQVTCLDYYCRACWENIHEKGYGEHQPIMRKFR